MFGEGASLWWWYLAATIGVVLGARWIYRSAFSLGEDDPSGMLGQHGQAQGTFTQDGMVLVRGELWRATSDGGIIQKGDTVQVQEVRAGLVLVVHRVER